MIDGDLLEGAIAFARARAAARERRRTRDLQDKIGDRAAGIAACQAVRATLAKTARGARAPFAAVDAIEACLTMDFDSGSRREIELFADCVLSVESKAMRHLFFAEREAGRIPDVPKDTPTRAIARAAVVGAGTMGGGIAMAYANAGIPVLLKDVDQAALDRGMSVIRKNYASTMAKGRMTPEAMERTLALITPATSYDGFGDVDIVVEAVFENMDLKKSTFAELTAVTRPDAILASNTSTLDIDELAAASGRGTQVVGHHFFSPANVMKLLEIVRGRATSTEVIATSVKLAKQLNKVGVVVGNCFGFVANRMLAYYMREAYLLLEEGASVSQIDNALTDFGYPVGPFGMQDIAGIDVGWRIRQHLKSVGKTRAEGPQSAVPDRLYALGRYGQKTGAGWYRYESWQPNTHSRSTRRRTGRGSRGRARRHAACRPGRGNHRADHDGARQRRRSSPGRGIRHTCQRHRRRVRARVRLSPPPRRPDVLRRHRRAADRSGASQRVSPAVRRLLAAVAIARETGDRGPWLLR